MPLRPPSSGRYIPRMSDASENRAARDEHTTAYAAGGDERLSSPRTDPAVEHDRALQRERERFGGMRFWLGFFGWLTATGMTVLLVALVTAVAALFGAQNASGSALSSLGIGGAIALLAILLVAYFCGGYVSGRMARFIGLKQGFAVWLWAVIIANGYLAQLRAPERRIAGLRQATVERIPPGAKRESRRTGG